MLGAVLMACTARRSSLARVVARSIRATVHPGRADEGLTFHSVSSLAQLNREVQAAAAQGQP